MICYRLVALAPRGCPWREILTGEPQGGHPEWEILREETPRTGIGQEFNNMQQVTFLPL